MRGLHDMQLRCLHQEKACKAAMPVPACHAICRQCWPQLLGFSLHLLSKGRELSGGQSSLRLLL